MKRKRLLMCLMMMVNFNGCFYTSLPDLPDLQPQSIKPIKECANISLPEAIPKTLFIDIKPDSINTDANGEFFLRNYAKLRKNISDNTKLNKGTYANN